MKMLTLITLLLVGSVVLSAADTIVVTNIDDSGPGSLRDAIQNSAAGDTIAFDLPSPSTIELTTGELLIDKDLIISGPGPAELVLKAVEPGPFEAGFRIFEIAASDIDVTIAGITITGAFDAETGLDGGGLLNQSTGTVEIRNCAITQNFVLTGGGISNYGNLQIDQSTISNNSAFGAFESGFRPVLGGGIHNSGTLTVVNTTISDNTAAGHLFGPPDASGAGIYNNGTFTLINCTITRNVITEPEQGSGGGIFSEGGSGTVTNCTISGNDGDLAAGGVENASGAASITLMNDIIAGNTSLSHIPDVFGAFNSAGHNLIGDDNGGTITPATGDQIGTDVAPIDPKLGPLQDNGGPTQTLALLPGSPAIDKGAEVAGITTDQRGRFRPTDDPSVAPAPGGNNNDIGAFELQADQSINISTRAQVSTDQNILDGGFIITGTDPKQVLIRGLGPSLTNSQITGSLVDPVLELFDGSTLLQTNDNWKDTQEAEIEATGIAPAEDAESSILVTLSPGEYTAILEGKDGGTGIGLIEIYDLDAAANSSLGNISSRGFVGTDDNVMIGGFILGAGGGIEATVLVRAIGPSLASKGVVNPLLDPVLELHDENGALITSNDSWKDTQQAEIEATDLAPTDDREAAILQTLAGGAYTAIVRGSDNTTGVALVEVYNLY